MTREFGSTIYSRVTCQTEVDAATCYEITDQPEPHRVIRSIRPAFSEAIGVPQRISFCLVRWSIYQFMIATGVNEVTTHGIIHCRDNSGSFASTEGLCNRAFCFRQLVCLGLYHSSKTFVMCFLRYPGYR